ncbi:hypothetical protein WS71_10055 [Burkholderia mayonis]|uniref:Uncharacterized protein n=1 Tax=Burkholderia mayonis TaxID=1385591 RepID=A0A1B4FVA3_9BURK|nr:hypothetical protein WS71_10055 [Burkholderia mayonis]KVE58333.1 hypothetical protein WS71_24600 [Burkholderia mayonis]
MVGFRVPLALRIVEPDRIEHSVSGAFGFDVHVHVVPLRDWLTSVADISDGSGDQVARDFAQQVLGQRAGPTLGEAQQLEQVLCWLAHDQPPRP